ncbi:MAG: hypothetical protein WAP52_01480 [Candidatus Sungiibacteriota bacterium]
MQGTEEFTITNIRLPRRDLKALKHAALMKDQSVNALLRGLIHRYLRIGQESRDGDGGAVQRSIWDLPRYAGNTGETHLADRVDEVVYGK